MSAQVRRRKKIVTEEKAMYTSLLIPTDGSELAGKAVQHGIALAKWIGAKVTPGEKRFNDSERKFRGAARILVDLCNGALLRWRSITGRKTAVCPSHRSYD